MTRAMIGPSKGERELAEHVGEKYSFKRTRESKRVMAGAAGVVITVCIIAVIIGVAFHNVVPDQYTVMWFGEPEMYLGELDLTTAGEDFLREATFVLHLEIPEWGINEVRQMSHENRSVSGKDVDFLSGVPLNGQVTEKTTRSAVDFTLWLEIGSDSSEVADLKLLGGYERITGKLCNHPDKDLVTLEHSGQGVSLEGHKDIIVNNEPTLPMVSPWTISFSKQQIS